MLDYSNDSDPDCNNAWTPSFICLAQCGRRDRDPVRDECWIKPAEWADTCECAWAWTCTITEGQIQAVKVQHLPWISVQVCLCFGEDLMVNTVCCACQRAETSIEGWWVICQHLWVSQGIAQNIEVSKLENRVASSAASNDFIWHLGDSGRSTDSWIMFW